MSSKKILKSIFFGLLLFFLSTGFTFARAGGGESFGDGGFDTGGGSFDFGGGSSFDSGSGIGGSIGSLSGTDSSFSCVVCLIFLVIIVLIAYFSRKGGTLTTSTVNSSSDIAITNRSNTEEELKENLSQLKKLDPKFDMQKFKTHAKKVFMAVQKGWTERDQEVCRPFMAEEVYQSHQMQIENMKRNKTINVLENIVVGSIEVVRIDLDEEYHKIVMKVRASMKDYKVNEDNLEKVIEGNKQQSPPFTEYWAFIRRSNLKTKIKDGIFDRKCPNCGAPIKVDIAGKCKYCEANVVNGDYDWVLSEIIQKGEWS